MKLQKNARAAGRFATAMKFAAWLQALPARLTPPPFRLLQIGSAFWQSRALYVAARLDIATVIGDAELSGTELAKQTSADPDTLTRLLRFLVAMGVFSECGAKVFRNNKVSHHLRTDHAQSVRAMVLMHNSDAMARPWFEQLEQGVRRGVPPFRLTHGNDLFEYLDGQAEFDQLFAQAMDSVEALAGDSFATEFDWSQFDRVIDVGGSRGSKAVAILRRHPGLRAVVVDRAQVVAEAQRFWQARQSPEAARLLFQAGDVLSQLPSARSSKDIFLLSAVLHGFDDDTCVQALLRLAQACGDTGAPVALMEIVLPENHADVALASFDMQMFMATRGRERTLAQWTQLFARSGMALQEVVRLQSFASILVLRSPSRG